MKGKENQDCTLEMKGFRVREKSIKGGSGRSTVEKHTEREENMKIIFSWIGGFIIVLNPLMSCKWNKKGLKVYSWSKMKW